MRESERQIWEEREVYERENKICLRETDMREEKEEYIRIKVWRPIVIQL